MTPASCSQAPAWEHLSSTLRFAKIRPQPVFGNEYRMPPIMFRASARLLRDRRRLFELHRIDVSVLDRETQANGAMTQRRLLLPRYRGIHDIAVQRF